MLPHTSKYDDENICVAIKAYFVVFFYFNRKVAGKKGAFINERFIVVHVENDRSINRISEAAEEVP